jgi:DNA-directed RNA polymerase specialized sigma24 family protein
MDDAGVRRVLHGIVNRMVSDGAAHEDLMQEALIHLFLLEQRRPQQTQSWYLQSCRFSLQNLCASGRSVDSMKRRHGRLDWPEDDGPSDWVHSRAEHKDEVLSQVSANDIVSLLSKRLSPREQLILTYLAEGLGVREIAVILKVSHPAVIKHRRKIAALALKLGIQPLPNGRRKKVDDSRQLDLPELELRPECRTCKYRAMALRGQCA